MEKFKKYFVIGISVVVFLTAVVMALNLTFGSLPDERGINKISKLKKSESLEMASPAVGIGVQKNEAFMDDMGARGSMMSIDGGSMESTDSATGTIEVEKKEIKNGDLNLKVSSADKAAEKIMQIAKDNGGEVFSSNFSQSENGIKSGRIEVRVPVNNFEKTFVELKSAAVLVVNESTYGQDVTMEYSDLKIQLKNKQAEEQSFVKILDQSGKISDVLEVTQQIARVRNEIERLQGRIRFMDSQTDLAKISIFLTEDMKVSATEKWRPLQVMVDTLNGLLRDMQGFVDFLIVLIVRVIPLLALYGGIIFFVYWVIKRIFFKNNI